MTYNNPAAYEKVILISFMNSYWYDKEDEKVITSKRLDPDIFIQPFHRDIVKAINFLLDKNQICDDLAVEYYARKSKWFSEMAWSEIIGTVPMPVKSVEFYIDLLTRNYKNNLLKGIGI